MLRDIADFEMELEEGLMTEFDQNALSKNYVIFQEITQNLNV